MAVEDNLKSVNIFIITNYKSINTNKEIAKLIN